MAPTAHWRDTAESLRRDLDSTFGPLLRALVVYEAHGLAGDPIDTDTAAEIRHGDLLHTLAVVDRLDAADLARLASFAPGWQARGLAVPLVLTPGELARSLDAFPLEFAQILAHHVLLSGSDPFVGLALDRADLRRGCETETRSHLLHLREGYLQAGGDVRKVGELLAASARPLRALLANIARLHGVNARSPDALLHFVEERLHLAAGALRPVVAAPKSPAPGPDLAAGFAAHLAAIEQLARVVDEWTV